MRILQLVLIYLTYMSEYGVNGRVLKNLKFAELDFQKILKN